MELVNIYLTVIIHPILKYALHDGVTTRGHSFKLQKRKSRMS